MPGLRPHPKRPEAPALEIDDRRAMTKARKARIWGAWDGNCWFCNQPVPMTGPKVVYDHINPLWMKGSDADAEFGPIHAEPCNKLKTAADAAKRAKVKRIHRKSFGQQPTTSFRWAKRKMESRGFDKGRRKRMNGTVERRP